jgi:hypothetical protein
MDTIAGLEHSLLERTGRAHVADIVYDYLVGRFVAGNPESVVTGTDAAP